MIIYTFKVTISAAFVATPAEFVATLAVFAAIAVSCVVSLV